MNTKNDDKKIVVWFTGLSGSGKTTIAEALKKELEARGKRVHILDGDVVRNTLHRNLGFSREDIRENNRLIAEFAREKNEAHDIVLVPIISPYREDRKMARQIVGDGFIELYINCPLEECMRRDVKGLYRQVREGKRGKLIGMEGGEHPYEAPFNPELEIMTKNNELHENKSRIIIFLSSRGYI